MTTPRLRLKQALAAGEWARLRARWSRPLEQGSGLRWANCGRRLRPSMAPPNEAVRDGLVGPRETPPRLPGSGGVGRVLPGPEPCPTAGVYPASACVGIRFGK